MGGADVISLVVGDGCGAVVVGHVVSVVVVIVGVRVSEQGRQGAGRHGDSKRGLGQVEPAPVQAVCILLLLPQITYSMMSCILGFPQIIYSAIYPSPYRYE